MLAAVLTFIMVSVSQTIGLAGTGFTEDAVQRQFFFYVAPGIGFLIGIILLMIIEVMIKKGDDKYGDSLCFNSPGETPGLPFKIFENPFKLFLISMILFSILGIYSAVTKQSFTGMGVLRQQFTVVGSVLYNFALIPASENLGAAFFFAFTLFLWRYTCRKFNVSDISFMLVAMLIAVITFGAYGYANHLLRYGASDVSIKTVIFFWSAGGLITVLTGSFIPFWVMHADNNLFVDLGRHFSSDLVVYYTIAGIVVMIITYVLLFIRRNGKKHRRWTVTN